MQHKFSACVRYGCTESQALALHRPGVLPGSAGVVGQDWSQSQGFPPVSPLRHTAWDCALLLGQRVQSIVTIKPEVNYSNHNKVVLKETKQYKYNLQRPSSGISLDDIDSENV